VHAWRRAPPRWKRLALSPGAAASLSGAMHRVGSVFAQLAGGSNGPRQQVDFGASTGESSGPEPGVRDGHAMVPARDGVQLSCALTFPTEHGEGPWPVLVQFRYAGDGSAPRQGMAALARKGFVVGFCLFRGVHTSEGKYEGYHTQAKDGHDVVEWLAEQSFCNGKVGTYGSSQGGYAQNLLAGEAPPSLVAQYMIDTGMSLYHEAFFQGGGGMLGPLAFGGGSENRPGPFLSPGKYDDNNKSEIHPAWADHPHYDEYWAEEDSTPHIGQMNVPCCTIGSWYDYMCQGSIAAFVGRQRLGGPGSRGSQTLICGPWLHGGPKETAIGELTLPPQAAFPYEGGMEAHIAAYFRHYMYGDSLPQTIGSDGATVHYYVQGAVDEADSPGNEWRTASDWPLLAMPTKYYLSRDGELQLNCPPSPSSTAILADPENKADNGTDSTSFPGARDGRFFESQTDRVKTFTTAPLTEPVEWTGAVHAAIAVRAGAPDCDIIVRVCDVYPDGRSILIADRHRRASFRHSLNEPPLPPLSVGEECVLQFRVGWMSQAFAPGHRIRVTVSCTGMPLYETGGSGNSDATGRVTHEVLHGGATPSYILTPLIPSGDTAACVDMSEEFVTQLSDGVFPA
jgi:predicted acyl esterase